VDSSPKKPLQRSGSEGSISKAKSTTTGFARSASAGSVNTMPADAQAQAEIKELAQTATEDMLAGDDDDDGWGAPAPKAVNPPKAIKAISTKSRPSSIGAKKGAKKPIKAVKVTAVKAVKVGGASAGGDEAPKKKKDDWGDMDGFDDAKWESIKTTSAKAEADASKPKNIDFEAASVNTNFSNTFSAATAAKKPATDNWDDFEKDEPGIQIVDKNWNKGKKAAAAAAKAKADAVAAESTELRDTYRNAKSISSDQVHGTEDGQGDKNYSQYMGQRSLGSDQYFGRGSGDYDEDDYDDDDDDLDGLVNNLAEETRRDLRVAAQMAGQFISNLSERYS